MKLNLGCGKRIVPGYINIDDDDHPGVDLIINIYNGLPFEDNSVDKILASDFLEHIPQPKVIFVIDEIWRVLKPDGIFESSTPSTEGCGAFQNPLHVSFWNINSWYYWTIDEHREEIGAKAKFKGIVNNVRTSHNIIHVKAMLRAVKGV